MSGTTGSPQEKKPIEELENWNLDRSVTPYTMVRGIMAKDGTGAWQYVKANADGSIATDENEPTDIEGLGKISVGTTAVSANFTGVTESIIFSADSANTGELYVGKSNVTSAGANALAFLLPGESLVLDYNDATNALWVVASVSAQNFYAGATI